VAPQSKILTYVAYCRWHKFQSHICGIWTRQAERSNLSTRTRCNTSSLIRSSYIYIYIYIYVCVCVCGVCVCVVCVCVCVCGVCMCVCVCVCVWCVCVCVCGVCMCVCVCGVCVCVCVCVWPIGRKVPVTVHVGWLTTHGLSYSIFSSSFCFTSPPGILRCGGVRLLVSVRTVESSLKRVVKT
jgi:hypothetical protein